MKKLLSLFLLFAIGSCAKKKDNCTDCKSSINVGALTDCRDRIDAIFAERLTNWATIGRCDTCFVQQAQQCRQLAGTISSAPCDSIAAAARAEVYSGIASSTDMRSSLDSAEVANARSRVWQGISEEIECFQ